jgi:hypothetical protein
MERPDIRKDSFYQVPLVGGDKEATFLLNAKYDRMDVYRPLGIWLLKILDDELGLVTAIMEESKAIKLAEQAELPIVERKFLFESEYESYMDAIADNLDDIFKDND